MDVGGFHDNVVLCLLMLFDKPVDLKPFFVDVWLGLLCFTRFQRRLTTSLWVGVTRVTKMAHAKAFSRSLRGGEARAGLCKSLGTARWGARQKVKAKPTVLFSTSFSWAFADSLFFAPQHPHSHTGKNESRVHIVHTFGHVVRA